MATVSDSSAIDSLQVEKMEKLLKINHFVERAINASSTAIYIYDIRTNRYEFINAAYTRILGYTLDQIDSLKGQDFLALFHPEDIQRVNQHMAKVTSATDVNQTFEIEYRFLNASGEWVWCLCKDAPFEFDSQGNITKVIGSFMDITRQKKAELAVDKETELKRALKQLRYFTEGSQDGFWHWKGPANDVVEWSDQFWTLIGHEKDSFTSSLDSFMALLHEDDLDATLEQHNKAIQEGTLFEVEYRIRSQSGEYRWFRGRGTPYFDGDGNLREMAGSITDIHQKKMLEQQLINANQDLEHFAFVASHDLKEPVRTIKTFANYLLKDVEAGDMARCAEDQKFIRESCDKMTNLIEAMLHLSRVGNNTYVRESCTLQALVDEVAEQLQVKVDETRAVIQCHNGDAILSVDPTQFRVALQNLMQNALKFHKPGISPEIRVRAMEQGCNIAIEVRDNGIGIPKEQHKQVFGVFKKLGSDRATEGTGIGLAVVEKVMARHGGRVELRSTVGEGSTFTLILPKK